MNITLTFGRNSQLIWALILPAFVGLIPLVICLELTMMYIPDNDWIFLLATLFYIGFVAIVTFKLVKSIRTDVDISFNDSQMSFTFIKRNIFHRNDFALCLSNLVDISEDSDKGYDFLYFETINTPYPAFHLMTEAGNDKFDNFKVFLFKAIDDYSKTSVPGAEIKLTTIYQKWPMKLLALIFLTSWFIFPVAMYYNEVNWLISTKYWFCVLISSPILFKVYIHNYRK